MFKGIEFISDINLLPINNKENLRQVTQHFPFLATTYYLSLIDFSDPFDPLKRIVIPDLDELKSWGKADPSNENVYTVMEGVQHKYDSTLLVIASERCAGMCRYCFRKRLFLKDNYAKPEKLQDLKGLIKYIEEHKEITNVIISGGDALMLPTSQLETLIKNIMKIDHIRFIRLGTRILSYWPYRITEDTEFLEMINKYSKATKRIYVVTHFDHPREITHEAVKAVNLLHKAGAVLLNQCPLIKGINDSVDTLFWLFTKLASIGVAPYYVFQCRPAIGNKPFAVPIEKGYKLFEKAKAKCCGVAKRARFVISHAIGKLEVLALTEKNIFFKFHRAAKRKNEGKLLICERNPEAFWPEDYISFEESFYS